MPAPTTQHQSSSPLINREFALLWSGQAISAVGDYAFTTTLVLWIAAEIARGRSWSPLAVSGVVLAASLPTAILGPIAGVFVDRWNKRRTMLWMDAIRAVLIAGLAGLPLLQDRLAVGVQLGIIYAVVVLAAICSQFFSPSRLALVGDIVPRPQQPRASALLLMTTSIAILLGPPLAAPLYVAAGAGWALGVNALSFAVSFAALFALRAPVAVAPSPERRGIVHEFASGVRFFAGNRVLRALLVATVLTLVGSSAINALGIFFATENLDVSDRWYGTLSAASGAGVLIGALIAGRLVARVDLRRLFWSCTLAVGALLLLYARMTHLAPALIVLLVLGLPSAGVNVATGPLLLRTTPHHLVGRVSALLTPATHLAATLGTLLAGYLASTVLRDFHTSLLGLSFGRIDTIYTGSALLVLAGGLYAMLTLRGHARPMPTTPTPSSAEIGGTSAAPLP